MRKEHMHTHPSYMKRGVHERWWFMQGCNRNDTRPILRIYDDSTRILPECTITRPVSLSRALYLLLKCRMNWNFCERILFYMWNHLLSELSTYLRWALLFAITKSVHVWWVDVSKATVSSIKKVPRILSEDNKNSVDLTLCWKNKALENPFFRVNGAK